MFQSVFGSSRSDTGAPPASVGSAKAAVDVNLKERLKGIAASVVRNQTVVETRKFAGQEIT